MAVIAGCGPQSSSSTPPYRGWTKYSDTAGKYTIFINNDWRDVAFNVNGTLQARKGTSQNSDCQCTEVLAVANLGQMPSSLRVFVKHEQDSAVSAGYLIVEPEKKLDNYKGQVGYSYSFTTDGIYVRDQYFTDSGRNAYILRIASITGGIDAKDELLLKSFEANYSGLSPSGQQKAGTGALIEQAKKRLKKGRPVESPVPVRPVRIPGADFAGDLK